ncbi:MAG: endonuclease/exonuclease/phosphatase family protein [Thermoleophilaceae bacterium]
MGTFNLFAPGLRPRSPSDREAILRRWGRNLLFFDDFVTLSEVHDYAWAKTLSDASGLKHIYPDKHTGDVVVLSRFPFTSADHYYVVSPDQHAVDVTMDVEGVRQRVLATHWYHRPLAWEVGDERREAADRLAKRVQGESGPVFVGGDLNACAPSNNQPVQQCEGKVAPGSEYWTLVSSGGLIDAFTMLDENHRKTSAAYCSNKRIDFILFRGQVRSIRYDCAFEHAPPSDHPYTRVIFDRK